TWPRCSTWPGTPIPPPPPAMTAGGSAPSAVPPTCSTCPTPPTPPVHPLGDRVGDRLGDRLADEQRFLTPGPCLLPEQGPEQGPEPQPRVERTPPLQGEVFWRKAMGLGSGMNRAVGAGSRAAAPIPRMSPPDGSS